ncbi:TOMM precursor leader peptide-binding protein [Micromonospora sp. LOL_024]|uniref:TOMM precursor leader peptide-binding protein n=1 Tax=Micromonospora sp. LOL_024 TaxID=3345412 RepID=UPI003A844748
MSAAVVHRSAATLTGQLAETLAGVGLPWPVLAGPSPDTAGPAVVVLEEWTPADAAALSARAWQTGVPLLPVRADGGTLLVGPLLHPAAPACLACVETERLATLGGRTPRHLPDLLLGGVIPPTALPVLAAVAQEMIIDRDRWTGLVWAMRTTDGTCHSHRVRCRRGGCELCGPIPVDSPANARFKVASRPLADPYRLRQENPATTVAGLRAALHDARLGPVAHLSRRENLPLALAHAEVVGDWEVRDGGYGRASTFHDAERTALFEAVERMAGLSPLGRRTSLRASFAELGAERAVDPVRLGLPDEDLAARPEHELHDYDPGLVVTWVQGWSLGEQRALAVPEHVAYWGHPIRLDHGDSPQFLLESSNGCGLGNSLEEATLYGLLEVAERDAFMMAWYARTPLDGIRVPDEDPLVQHLVDRLDFLGYELRLFDSTNDFGLPAVAALALCPDADSDMPQAFFAGGAHPDPREAIRAATVEVVVNLMLVPEFTRTWPDLFDPVRLRRLLAEPHRVVTLHDHMALHTLPEARERFAFLLDGAEPRPWREIWPDAPRPVADLGVLLTELADRVAGAGMDVIVVDQSDPVVREQLGLHAAKVVVPGAIPLTFGHVYRRTRGLHRLLEVPWRLGRVDRRLRYSELPLHPHPFP